MRMGIEWDMVAGVRLPEFVRNACKANVKQVNLALADRSQPGDVECNSCWTTADFQSEVRKLLSAKADAKDLVI